MKRAEGPRTPPPRAPPPGGPPRWGLPIEAVESLADRLWQFWQRYRLCFCSRTRDPSLHAHSYLRAQLTMDSERNFANIGRTLHDEDGQSLQHFMTHSP